MFIVFTGFFGLIGYTYYFTLPCFLIGCNFAYHLLNWPDPSIAILHRKMWLVIYLIIGKDRTWIGVGSTSRLCAQI